MRHKHGYRKLGKDSSHRKAMLKNLTIALITHEKIETTLPKAKELRSVAEKLITKAKAESINKYKYVFSKLQNKEATKRLVDEIAPKYKERKGGYTRIVKTRLRVGDNAPMAYIQLV
jgi:large subunit ribosomal protein L17